MRKKSLGFKSITWALILSFSYTQLLWASPRDLQAQAKSFFDEEAQRRGMSADELTSQGPNQSAVDRQNLLQTLEGPVSARTVGDTPNTFSLTTENGDILKYVGNALSQVQRPNDGPLLTNVHLNNGVIDDATLNFLDGSIQKFADGKINEYTTPDGTKVEYNLVTGKITQTTKDGKITKYNEVNGDLVLTTYPDASLNPETILYIATYGPENKLKSAEDRIKHTTTFYTNGLLERIVKEDGTQITFNHEVLNVPTEEDPLATQTRVTFKDYLDADGNSLLADPTQLTLPDGSTLRDIVWVNDKANDATLESIDGNAYSFMSKAVTSITIPGGSVLTQITWNADAFQGGKLTSLDRNTFNYLNGVLSTINLENSSLIEGMQWADNGEFTGGTLTDSQDNKFTFENRKVVKIELKNSYVIEGIIWNGNSIKDCSLTKDGNKIHYINNAVTSIDLSDGSTLTETVFNSNWEIQSGLLTRGNNQYRITNHQLTWINLSGTQFEILNSEVTRVSFSNGSTLGAIVWLNGRIKDATFIDQDHKEFKFENGKLIQIIFSGNVFTIQDGAVTVVTTPAGVWRNIVWSPTGTIKDALLTDSDHNVFTFTDYQIVQITLENGSILKNIVWNETGRVKDATLTDLQNNRFIYKDGVVSEVTLNNGDHIQNILWDEARLAQNALLTDLDHNEFTFTNRQLDHIKLPDGSILQNVTWDTGGAFQNALLIKGANRFHYLNSQIQSIDIPEGHLEAITWDSLGQAQNALLTDALNNQYTFVNGQIDQVTLQNSSLIKNIVWKGDGTIQDGLFIDPNGNQFTIVMGEVSQIVLANNGPTLRNIVWGDDRKIKNALLTDQKNNQFTYLNGLLSEIAMPEGSKVTNVVWDAAGNFQSGKLTDTRGNVFNYSNGLLTKVDLSAGGSVQDITWGPDGRLKDAVLKYQNNEFKFVSGVITEVTLEDRSVLKNILWAPDGTIKDAVLTVGGDPYVYVNKILTSSTVSGVLTTYTYTTGKITATSNGTKYEYRPDKILLKQINPNGSYSTFNLQGLKDKDYSSTNVMTAFYEYWPRAGGILQAKQLIASNNTTFLDRGSFERTEFKFKTTSPASNKVVLTAVQSAVSTTTRSFSLTYQSGVWTILASDKKGTITTQAYRFTAPQTLVGGKDYVADLEYLNNKLYLYVYEKGQAIPQNPIASLDVFSPTASTQIKFNAPTYANTLTKSNKVYKQLQSPEISTLRAKSLTDKVDTLKNLTLTKREVPSITQKDTSFTGHDVSFSRPDWSSVTKKQLNIQKPVFSVSEKRLLISEPELVVQKRTLTVSEPQVAFSKPDWSVAEQTVTSLEKPDLSTAPNLPVFQGLKEALLTQRMNLVLSKPVFSVSNKILDVSKPVVELPEEALRFEEMLYNQDATLKEVHQGDGTILEFDKGLLTKVTDTSGQVITATFQPPSDLGNLMEVMIAEEGGPASSYDSEGRLSSVKASDMTIYYKDGNIDSIEKNDKTKLSGLRFDQGMLLDADVLTPEGEKRTYREGRLTNITKPDDSVLEFEFNEETFKNNLKKLVLNPEITYEFTYVSPESIEANLTTPVPDALSIIKMTYDNNLNLKKAIRKNNEIIEYTQDHKIGKITPPNQGEENAQVYNYSPNGNYTVTQGKLKSFYGKDNALEKVVIDSSADNHHTLEVSYRYGNIKDIKKDSTPTFEYSYTSDEDGKELTHIKDLEEDTLKTYKDELLLKSTDNKTGALSSYLYNEDRTVSQVKVTRLQKTLHTYNYTYPDGKTVVKDEEENITRTYGDAVLKASTLKEEPIKDSHDNIVLDKDGNILGYTFTQTDEPSTKTLNRQLLKLEKEGLVFTYTYSQHKTIDKAGKEILSEVMTQEELIQKTFEDESIADYKDGKLSKMTLKNGSVITDVEVNDDRSLKKAAITTSGVKKVFDQHTLLEEVLTDGNHLYYDDGRISKLIRPDGKEFTYSYEKDKDGNIVFAWVKTGTANLKYDLQGNLLGLRLEGVFSLDEVNSNTQHLYEGGIGPNSFDGNFETAQTMAPDDVSFGRTQGSNSASVSSTHIFPSLQLATGIKYRFYTSASGWGAYPNNNHQSGSYTVEYRQGSDTWLPFENAQGGLGDSGEVTRTFNIGGITAIRARAGAQGDGSDQGGASAKASIYEIQYTLLDKAFYTFSTQKDSVDNITGYVFHGDGGDVLYNAQSDLLSVNPVSGSDTALNTILNQAAQSLKNIIATLPKLLFMEKMNAVSFTPPNGVGTQSLTKSFFGFFPGFHFPDLSNFLNKAVYEMGRLKTFREIGKPLQTYLRKIVDGKERITVSDSNLIREYDLEGNLLGVRLPGVDPEPIEGSKSFIDHESSKNSITSYGNASLSTEGVPVGKGYAVFDGQGDYLALPDSPDWTPQGDFTLDFRIRFDSLTDGLGIVSHRQDANNLWAFDWSGNNLRFTQYEGGSKTIDIQNSWTPFPNMWNHLTLQKSGNEYKMFVNGVQVGTTQASATALKDFNGELWIGRNPRDTDRYLNGAMDEFKISSGSQTKLLLHFDGIDKSYYDLQKEIDSNGALTGYSLKGDGGQFEYSASGVLLASSFSDIVHQYQNGYKVTYLPTIANEITPSFYGDGRDGDVKISFDTTLTRNMYYKSLTIDPGVVFNANGYKIFVSGALVNNGIISADGGGAPGGMGGKGSYYSSNANNIFGAVSGQTGSTINDSLGGYGANGGGGGMGNSPWNYPAQGGTGGSGTSLVSVPAPLDLALDSTSNLKGGSSGGGGGGGGLGTKNPRNGTMYFSGGDGGKGGSGGGVVTIFAGTIKNSGSITARGLLGIPGAPGDANNNTLGGVGGAGGSGGAGGGGVIYLVSNSMSAGNLNASGGNSGTILRYEIPKTMTLNLPARMMSHKESYELINIQNSDKANWIAKANDSILDAQTIVFQEYSTSGALETQSKADGTVTVFDVKNRPSQVLDADGTVLIEYSYDEAGNPSRVYLKNARDTLPDEVKNSKLQIEENRAAIIRQIAIDHDSTKKTIKDAYADSIQALRDQLSLLDDKHREVSDMKVQGGEGKSKKGNILSQISSAKDKVSAFLIETLRTETNLLLANDDLAKQRSIQIQTETDRALVALSNQEKTLKKEILRQEVSPILYDHYRRILGRDPSQEEYDEWIEKIDYDSGNNGAQVRTKAGVDLTSALNNRLNDPSAQSELSQRSTYVQHVKDRVDQKIKAFLSSETLRNGILAELGLTEAELAKYDTEENPGEARKRDFDKILEWLKSRSNHFGQSASLSLEALLEQHNLIQDETGVTPISVREDILEKLILIDILTGIITPLDDGDLVISVFALNKVAKHYGLTLTGARLTWGDLLALYSPSATSAPADTPRIVAHINGNHFVVIRSITKDSISYMDPGAGPDKQNDIVTISKKEFLKVWEGNVTLEETKAQSVTNIQAKRLSIEETQKIRGAFFPLLIAALIAVMAQIGAAIFAVLSAIGTIVAGIASFVGALIANIGAAIGGILHGIGQALYMGIKFAVSTLFKVAGWVGTHMSQAVVGSIAKASFGQVLLETVVKVGVNFAVSKGLESIGVNPTIARFTSAFLTAGTNAFFDPKNAFSWGNFIAEGFKGVALVGSQDLLTRIGVDPQLASILSLVTSPFIDGIQTGHIGTELVNIIPQFTQSLSFYGIQKLADLAGLDPMVATLIGAPISAVIGGAGFDTGKTWGENAVAAINSGILRGATSLGIEYLTQEADLDPLLGALTSRAITGAIEGALGGNVFKGVFNGFKDSALNVARLGVSGTDSWSQAQYLQRVINFSDMVRNPDIGLLGAFERTASQILHEDSVSSILQSFNSVGAWLQDKINKHEYQAIGEGASQANRICASTGECVDFTSSFSDVTNLKRGAEEITGSWGMDDRGFAGFRTGTRIATDSLGNKTTTFYRDGNITEIRIDGPEEQGQDPQPPQFTIKKQEDKAGISFDKEGNVTDARITSSNNAAEVNLKNGFIEYYKEKSIGLTAYENDSYLINETTLILELQADGSYKRTTLVEKPSQAQPVAKTNLLNYLQGLDLSFISNWKENEILFWDWVTERQTSDIEYDTIKYSEDDWRTQEMIQTAGVRRMREEYKTSGYQTSQRASSFGTWDAFWQTAQNPLNATQAQVGGYMYTYTNNGNGMVTYKIMNQMSMYSFFYHIPGVPHKPRGGPFPFMGNLNQEFEWTEENP